MHNSWQIPSKSIRYNMGKHGFSILICAAFISMLMLSTFVQAESKNGFELSQASISSDQIFQGGPPRDGIPAINEPKFIAANQASFLKDHDRILGLALGNEIKAYPVNIMNWHEIVNDKTAGKNIAITFCPLCGTGMAFDTQIDGLELVLGVSGLLYQSDVLLYDRQTESLWSQIMSEAISGPMKGKKLKQLNLEHTSWKDWLKRYPKTKVLSPKTTFMRDYSRNPYAGYASSKTLYFDVKHTAPSIFHPKEQVLGITLDGQFKAYPFTELSKNNMRTFEDTFAGTSLKVHWNEQARSAYITNNKGDRLVSTTAFWFAWFTFHPDTLMYKTEVVE